MCSTRVLPAATAALRIRCNAAPVTSSPHPLSFPCQAAPGNSMQGAAGRRHWRRLPTCLCRPPTVQAVTGTAQPLAAVFPPPGPLLCPSALPPSIKTQRWQAPLLCSSLLRVVFIHVCARASAAAASHSSHLMIMLMLVLVWPYGTICCPRPTPPQHHTTNLCSRRPRWKRWACRIGELVLRLNYVPHWQERGDATDVSQLRNNQQVFSLPSGSIPKLVTSHPHRPRSTQRRRPVQCQKRSTRIGQLSRRA